MMLMNILKGRKTIMTLYDNKLIMRENEFEHILKIFENTNCCVEYNDMKYCYTFKSNDNSKVNVYVTDDRGWWM